MLPHFTYLMSCDKTFSLTYLGRFTARNFGYSNTDAIHHQLVEYYIAYLKQALENRIPFSRLDIQNPIESRLVSLEDDCLSVRSWRYRSFDTKGTLINERDVYKFERIVLCDCLCFEVVQSASRRQSGLCYGYLRRASDARYTIPESNLHELDTQLSAWLLKYRQFPRPPLVVIAIRRGFKEENSVDLLVFFAPNLKLGLDFVRSVTEMTCRAGNTKVTPRRRRAKTVDARYFSSPVTSPRGRSGCSRSNERSRGPRRHQDKSGNQARPLSVEPLYEPMQKMRLDEHHSNVMDTSYHCPCNCCQSMGLLPSIFTSSELERLQNRIMQYRLGQEALHHVYNRRHVLKNHKRPNRQASGGIQTKFHSHSCSGLNDDLGKLYEHNV
ncbi:hypothetical protein ECG_02069 [Echinococcus granulosus]|uniref:Uncharacterized protein n=2 Tax=Echinococcus granulosus TaxID=6210 RepID=A0A068WWM2_ECHGR|nr:hypothetical protein ECG_02069 [Echinococcus granulosus]CDS24546.1 hypothetical protein EgrG_000302400 [Echinococcus granulosus]